MTKKRWSALLLAVLMTLSLLPVTSFPVQAAGTYYLGSDDAGITDISWAALATASGAISGLDDGDTIVIVSTPLADTTLLSIGVSGVTVKASAQANLGTLTINVAAGVTSLTLQDLGAPAVTFASTDPATLTVVGSVSVGTITAGGSLTIADGGADASLTATSVSAAGGVSIPDASTYYIGVAAEDTAYDAVSKTAKLPWSALAYDSGASSYFIPGLAEDSTIIFVDDPSGSTIFRITADDVTLSSYDTLSDPNKQHKLKEVSLNAAADVSGLTLDKLVMDTAFSGGGLSLNATTPVTITVDGDSTLGAISSLGALDIEGTGALIVSSSLSTAAINVSGESGGKGTLSFSNALTVQGGGSSDKAIEASEIIFNGTGTETTGTRLTIKDTTAMPSPTAYTLSKGTSVSSDAIWYNNQSIASISGSAAKLENVEPFRDGATIWLQAPIRQSEGSGSVVPVVKDPSITLPVNGHRYKTGSTIFIETDAGSGLRVFSAAADPSVLTVKLDRPYDVVFAEVSPSFLDAWKDLSVSGTLSAPALAPGSGVMEALSFSQYSERITLDSPTPADGAKRFRLDGRGLTPGRYTVTLTTARGTVEHAFYYGSGFFLSGRPLPEAVPLLELGAPSTVKANNTIEFKVRTNRSGAVLSYRTLFTNWVAFPDTLNANGEWQTVAFTGGLSDAGTYEIKLSCDDPEDTPPVLARLEVVDPFTAQKDGFSFVNTWSSFGYSNGHSIDMALIQDVFGADWVARNASYAQSLASWGGSCHGFSTLAITIFGNGILDEVFKYSAINIPAPGNKDASMTKTFEAYQVLQGGDYLSRQWQKTLARNIIHPDTGANITQRHTNKGTQTPLADIVSLVSKCEGGAPPLLLCVVGPMGTGVGGHAIVAYDAVESPAGSGCYDVSIYDCNTPKKTRIMKIDLSTAATANGKLGTWMYDLYDDGRYIWGSNYCGTPGVQYSEISYYPLESINGQLANLPASFAKYHISGYLEHNGLLFNPGKAIANESDATRQTAASVALEDAADGAVIVSPRPMQRQLAGVLADGTVPQGDGSATFFGAMGEVYTISLGEGNAAPGKDFTVSLTEGERAASLSTSDKAAGITLDPIGGTAALQSAGGSFAYDFVDTTFSSPVSFRASGSNAGDLTVKPDGGGYVLSGAAGAVAVEFTRDGKTASGTVTVTGDTLVRMERNGTVGSYTYDEASGQYLDASGKPAAIFSDVNVTDWFYDYVNQAYYYGMIEGYGDGTFRPQNALTVAEFIKIAAVAAELDLPAVAEGGAWHQSYVAAAEAAGLLHADDAFYGAWDRPMLREEMAQVSVRLYHRNYADQLSSLDVSNVSFPDMDSIDTQYLESVKLAYTLGLLRGVDEAGTFQPKASLLRSEASALITRLR